MTKLEYLIKRFSEKGQNPENNKLVLSIQNRINEIIHKLIIMSKLDFDYSKCDDNPFKSLSNVESPSKQPNSCPVVYSNTKAIKRNKKKGNKVKSVYRIKILCLNHIPAIRKKEIMVYWTLSCHKKMRGPISTHHNHQRN